MSPKPVMVVDDDADLRETLRDVLESEGYAVAAAKNGRDALDVLEQRHTGQEPMPGCIILDLMMPVMDGRTFMEALAQNHADTWASIPILVATAVGAPSALENLPLPARVLKKPMQLQRLLNEVASFCKA